MLKSTKKSTTRTQRLNLATFRTKVEDFTSMLRTASNFFVRQLHQVNGDDTLRWLRWQTHAWNQLLRKLSNTNVNGESLVPRDFFRELLKVQEDTIKVFSLLSLHNVAASYSLDGKHMLEISYWENFQYKCKWSKSSSSRLCQRITEGSRGHYFFLYFHRFDQ